MCAGALQCEQLCLRSEHCRLGLERRRRLLSVYSLQRELRRRLLKRGKGKGDSHA